MDWFVYVCFLDKVFIYFKEVRLAEIQTYILFSIVKGVGLQF